jgi:hypothetical protein
MDTNNSIDPGGRWQNHNGSYNQIIGVGKYRNCPNHPSRLNLLGEHQRLGTFYAANFYNRADLFNYQGYYVYGSSRDFGELVFYSDDCGRWFSDINNFILKNTK